MKVYFMRHGKTDWNAAHKCQGHTNIPLNEEGRQMAREAAKRYSELEFDCCYVSPLDRAYETALLVTEGRNIPIIKDERLIEISLGKYEGESCAPEDQSHPLYPFFHSPGTYKTLETTESLEEVKQRGDDFINRVLIPLKDSNKTVLVVAHAVIIRAMLNSLRGIPKERFWEIHTGNCEIIEEEI